MIRALPLVVCFVVGASASLAAEGDTAGANEAEASDATEIEEAIGQDNAGGTLTRRQSKRPPSARSGTRESSSSRRQEKVLRRAWKRVSMWRQRARTVTRHSTMRLGIAGEYP